MHQSTIFYKLFYQQTRTPTEWGNFSVFLCGVQTSLHTFCPVGKENRSPQVAYALDTFKAGYIVNSDVWNHKFFDIGFSHEGQQYSGWVNPSDKLNAEGKPISFHVVLNDVSFGYVSYNGSWKVNEARPHALVECVEEQIERYYSQLEDAERISEEERQL